jgi:hypothetical protein
LASLALPVGVNLVVNPGPTSYKSRPTNPGYTAESRIHSRIQDTQQNPGYTTESSIHSRIHDTQQQNPGYTAEPKIHSRILEIQDTWQILRFVVPLRITSL